MAASADGGVASSIIGIFGGTFDPPHVAHLEVARTVLESRLVDSVLFIPCVAHAFDKTPVSFEHRVRMCALLIEGEDRMEVSDLEASLAHPGRTLDLIEALARRVPAASLRLVAGLDIYYERKRWYHFKRVEQLAPPLYVRREGQVDIPGLGALPGPPGISSTQVRALISRKESTAGLVTPAVRDYIDQHGLYEVK